MLFTGEDEKEPVYEFERAHKRRDSGWSSSDRSEEIREDAESEIEEEFRSNEIQTEDEIQTEEEARNERTPRREKSVGAYKWEQFEIEIPKLFDAGHQDALLIMVTDYLHFKFKRYETKSNDLDDGEKTSRDWANEVAFRLWQATQKKNFKSGEMFLRYLNKAAAKAKKEILRHRLGKRAKYETIADDPYEDEDGNEQDQPVGVTCTNQFALYHHGMGNKGVRSIGPFSIPRDKGLDKVDMCIIRLLMDGKSFTQARECLLVNGVKLTEDAFKYRLKRMKQKAAQK